MVDSEKGAPPPYNVGYPPQGYSAQGYGTQGYQAPPPASLPPGENISGYYHGTSDSPEDSLFQSGRGFDDVNIRNGFIRKVYAILFMQFGITSIFCMIFCISEKAKDWCQTPQANAFMWANLAILIVTEIALICCEGVRRKSPLNLIVLGVFTVSMSFFVGIVASTYEPEAVLAAAGTTALIVLALTIFSFQTKWDFTGSAPYLFVILIIFIIFGIFASIFNSEVVNIVYASIGVLIFSLYLVYDTQLLIGGKKYQLNEEEYVFAALSIYIDVIQIFLYLLELFGRR